MGHCYLTHLTHLRPMRPLFTQPDPITGKPIVTQEWKDAYRFRVEHPEYGVHEYIPTAKGLEFHESKAVNCLIEGPRGTGKSMIIRNDAHMRALAYPGYTYLIVRRTMPELKKTHLKFMNAEMRKLGGTYHNTDAIAYYPNGSLGFYGHCETEDDMMKLLGSEYCAVYFDEITTFTWTMITKISSCLRVPEGSGLLAIVRGGTNPIGVSAAEVNAYFREKNVDPLEDPDYDPEEYQSIATTLDDNPYIDKAQYIRRLSSLPDHIKRAWLNGEWIVEGAYFHDFKESHAVHPEDVGLLRWAKLGQRVPWHVTDDYPIVTNRAREYHDWMNVGGTWFDWVQIYRALDWGFSPDPAVCLWIAVLPNGRSFVFKEKHWYSTPAHKVAQDIKEMSKGMRVVETFCDPTLFSGSEATSNQSLGDIIESHGIALTESINDRAALGYAIHEYLNTVLEDGQPKLQIHIFGCPKLVKTLPDQRVHKTHPERIADSSTDHWTVTLGYYCVGRVGTSREYGMPETPRWMRPVGGQSRRRLGSESVRRRS